MSNHLITARCNRKCSFCFALLRREKMKKSDLDMRMTMDEIRHCMDFQEASGERVFRLLGGEPTLHPEFVQIVTEALDRGFHVNFFSNCIMTKEKADFLAEIPRPRLSVLANVSPQADDTPKQIEMRNYALEKLGASTALGITVTSPEIEYTFLIDTIKRYKLAPKIRVGIAQPIVGHDNDYLHPNRYAEIGEPLAIMAEECAEHDILIGFDCGMTFCMFTAEQMGRIIMASDGFNALCNPIIDIGPGLEVWSCFPLSEVLRANLSDFDGRHQIVEYYQDVLAPWRSLGCKPECLKCAFKRRGQCTGGCLAHAISSVNRPPPQIATGVRERVALIEERKGSRPHGRQAGMYQ